MYGVWRIDDNDNSFSTQPFRIKYARQDVLLSIMIAFNLSLGNREVIFVFPVNSHPFDDKETLLVAVILYLV